MARITPQKEHTSTESDAREGELVFFKDGVYVAKEVADIRIPIPQAIKRLGEMNYDVVGLTVYKGKVRLLLLPQRGRPKAHVNIDKKARFAVYMRRRYWLQNYGCEPPEEKGKKHEEGI